MTHLCGGGAGDEFAKRAFRLTDGQRCGDHESGVSRAHQCYEEWFDRLARNGDERN